MFDNEIKISFQSKNVNIKSAMAGQPSVTKEGILIYSSKIGDLEDCSDSYMEIIRDSKTISFMCGYESPKFQKWQNELPVFVNYFKKVQEEYLSRLNIWPGYFDFTLRRFYEARDQSEQSDYFIDHHEGWFAFIFGEDHSDLFRVPQFKEQAESRFIYIVPQYDCDSELWIFHKNLTNKDIDQSFTQLLGIRKASAELHERLRKTSTDYSLTDPWRYLDEQCPPA